MVSGASDDDLDAMFVALSADSSDSDNALDQVVQLAAPLRTERFAQRGVFLCKHMRISKKSRVLSHTGPVAQHTMQTIDRCNADWAKTAEDVIDLSLRKPLRITGKGAYKRWLPSAIQRACWGLRPRPRICKRPPRRIHKKRPAQVPAPTTMSTRAYAVSSRAGITHVHNVRSAVSEELVCRQISELQALPRNHQLCMLELAFDETEEALSLDKVRSETVQMMTLQARLFLRRSPTDSIKFDIVIPPVALNGTAAEFLVAGVKARLPLPLAAFAALASRFVLIVNTDSGPSCLKAVRHFSTEVPVLSAPCRMHQGCLAMSGLLTSSGLLSALFCASLLLRRRRVQNILRSKLRKYMDEHLRISFEAPSPEHRQRVHSICNLLRYMLVQRLEHARGPDASDVTERLRALRRVQIFFVGPLTGPEVIHYCPYGCHESREHAISSIVEDLNLVMLGSPPVVPASNKWSKLLPATLWFAVFLSLGAFLPGMMRALDAMYDDVGLAFDEDDLVGFDDAKSFMRQESVRFRKTQRFLTGKSVPDKLMSTALALLPVQHIMNRCFQVSRRHSLQAPGMLAFVHASRSPVTAAMASLCRALGDEDDDTWAPLVRGRGWNQELHIAASTPHWFELGELAARFKEPLSRWPWRLGLLVGDEYSDEQKRVLAHNVITCCSHQDPFMVEYKRHLHTIEDVLSPQNIQFTTDLFKSIPISNIVSESSFAAAHTRSQSKHGNDANMLSRAADHVLGASKTILDSSVERQRHHWQGFEARRVVPRPKNAWRSFVQRHRKHNTMRQIGALWADMSVEERATWAPAPELAPAPPPPVPPPPPAPFPYCADEFYPIKDSCLCGVANKIATMCRQWEHRIGREPLAPVAPFHAFPSKICDDTWHGCIEDVPADSRNKVEVLRRRFDRWSTIFKVPTVAFDEAIRQFPLLYFGDVPDAAAGPHLAPAGVAALIICQRLRSQVFYTEACAPPQPGSVVRFKPVIDNIRSARQLALQLADADHSDNAMKITYTQIGLCAYRVEAIDDMVALEVAHAQAMARTRAGQQLTTLLASLDRPAARRRSSKKRPPAGGGIHLQTGKKVNDAGDDEVSDKEDANLEFDPLQAFDACIAMEADAVASHGESADLGHISDDGAEDMDLDVDANAGSDQGGGEEVPDDNALGGDTDEEVLPRLDISGQVHNPHNDAEILGRVSIVKEGTPSESVSLYCRRHGCAVMKRIADAPDTITILRWFKFGLNMPQGRDAGLVSRHKRALAEL